MITIIKSIKPMFNGLVTTMNKYSKDQYVEGTTLIDTTKAGAVKEYQTVVAVGPMVKGIEVGDVVYINPKRYMVMEHQEGSMKDNVIKDNMVKGFKFEIIDIDGIPHLYLFDNDIKFVATIQEFEENPSLIIEDKPKLIV